MQYLNQRFVSPFDVEYELNPVIHQPYLEITFSFPKETIGRPQDSKHPHWLHQPAFPSPESPNVIRSSEDATATAGSLTPSSTYLNDVWADYSNEASPSRSLETWSSPTSYEEPNVTHCHDMETETVDRPSTVSVTKLALFARSITNTANCTEPPEMSHKAQLSISPLFESKTTTEPEPVVRNAYRRPYLCTVCGTDFVRQCDMK